MDKVKIDLLRQKYDLGDYPSRRSPLIIFGRVFVIALVIFATVGTIFSYQVSSTTETSQFPKLTLFGTIKHFVISGDRELEGEENDRINFLLMGIGGEGHSGPQLTDTMIFASLRTPENELGMISIPRDLNAPIPGHGWRKINHANAFGEVDEKGSGPGLATDVVETILDQEINYYVRVDFQGFADLIDDIGGVDVYVDNAFRDPSYPSHGMEFAECDSETTINEEGEEVTTFNYDCRFETLVFEEGWTHMDGDTALKFVRSRHGTNGEGSDFARARRQQRVITAVKDKVFSASTYLNPSKINRILETLSENIATNLDTWEMIRLANKIKNIDNDEIVSHVLDASPDSPLYATTVNGAYVLLPKQNSWRPIQRLAENIFTEGDLAYSYGDADEAKPRFVQIEIQNGTKIGGFASRASQMLDGQGYDVVEISNADNQDYQYTVIYDFTDGGRPEELKELRDFLDAKVTLTTTGWLIHGDVIPDKLTVSSEDYAHLATNDTIDFLVILGENSDHLMR